MGRFDDTDGGITVYVGWLVAIVVCFVILLIIILGTFYTVGAGQRAVLLTWGKPNPVELNSGLHFKVPIAQSVIKMDVQTQKFAVDKTSAASSDLQTVTTDVAVNYYVNPESVVEIYTKVGTNYQDKVIAPAVQETVKAVTAKYTAEQLITKREEVKASIDSILTERLKSWNINTQAISITNFDFSPEFNAAIEQKVTTEQNALAAKNKLEQVQYEAQQRIAQAEGEAKAIQIQAQAIQTQGGQAYVQLQAISRWNGNLPTYIGGGAIPFININSMNLTQ